MIEIGMDSPTRGLIAGFSLEEVPMYDSLQEGGRGVSWEFLTGKGLCSIRGGSLEPSEIEESSLWVPQNPFSF